MKKKYLLFLLISSFFFNLSIKAEILKNIVIQGNDRIPNETILMFSKFKINDDINNQKIDEAIKNLYESNFFEDISIKYKDNLLTITVKEFPIINSISVVGIKAKKYKEAINKKLKLKVRSSYNEYLIRDEIESIKLILKDFGFYFSEVTPLMEELPNNLIDLKYSIKLGEKAKISKITFIGNKIFIYMQAHFYNTTY